MENLKILVFIYTAIGTALCLTFIAIISKFEKEHPNLFTPKATLHEKSRYTKIIKTSINILLIYIVFAVLALTMECYQTPPFMIIILCGIFIIFAILNLISTFKNKQSMKQKLENLLCIFAPTILLTVVVGILSITYEITSQTLTIITILSFGFILFQSFIYKKKTQILHNTGIILMLIGVMCATYFIPPLTIEDKIFGRILYGLIALSCIINLIYLLNKK